MNAWLQDKLVMTKCGAADKLQCRTALLAIQLKRLHFEHAAHERERERQKNDFTNLYEGRFKLLNHSLFSEENASAPKPLLWKKSVHRDRSLAVHLRQQFVHLSV